MAKYFRHPNGITVSEFQMLCIYLNRHCDYQIALRVVRDELGAKKEQGRYWLVGHDRVWNYLCINFNLALAKMSLSNIHDLIESVRFEFEKR
jgi:hypothetical protein